MLALLFSFEAIEMRRRDFITLFGGAAASPLLPLAARAQPATKRPLIAWLSLGAPVATRVFVDAFLQGMRDHGYAEGRQFDITYRFADGYIERLPALADEVVRLHPNVILAPASGPAVAAKNASATIPIVTPALADAVHLGLIASDSRPGGNVTGITPYVAGLPAKQMELAREVVPGAARVGVLANLSDPKAPPQSEELTAAGRELGVNVIVTDAPIPDDLERIPGARPPTSRCNYRAADLHAAQRARENRGAGRNDPAARDLRIPRACR